MLILIIIYVCIPSGIAIGPQGCSMPRHEFLRLLRLLHGHARHDPTSSGPRPQVHLPFHQGGKTHPLPRRATPQVLPILTHRRPQPRLQQVHQLHPRVIHNIEIIHNQSKLQHQIRSYNQTKICRILRAVWLTFYPPFSLYLSSIIIYFLRYGFKKLSFCLISTSPFVKFIPNPCNSVKILVLKKSPKIRSKLVRF